MISGERSILAILGILLLLPRTPPLAAQRLELRGSRSAMASHFTILSAGWAPILWGPFSLAGGGILLAGQETDLYGASADLALDLGPRWRLLAGGAVGFAAGARAGDWAGWSAGVGWDLIRRPFVVGAETRYREIPDQDASGVELGLRVAIPFRGRSAQPAARGPRDAPGAVAPAPASGTLDPAHARAGTVVEVALATMGTPYLWGGSDANGFDCSGLIQHAYATVGVALPRTSAEQARAGSTVSREVAALRPGDVLTFGSAAGVTHVGLYVGEEWFIHSSRLGVRTSRLRRDDPDGRWWFDRWLAARRILPEG